MPGSFDRLPPLSRAEQLRSYAASHFIGPMGWQAYYVDYCIEVYGVSFEQLPDAAQAEIASVGRITKEIIEQSENIATLPSYLTEHFSELPWQFFKFDFMQLFLKYADGALLEKIPADDLEHFVGQTKWPSQASRQEAFTSPQDLMTLKNLVLYANLGEERKKYLLTCYEKRFFDSVEHDSNDRNDGYLKLIQRDMPIENKIDIICGHHNLHIYQQRLIELALISVAVFSDEVKGIHQKILETLAQKILSSSPIEGSFSWDEMLDKMSCIDIFLTDSLRDSKNTNAIEQWIDTAKTVSEKAQRLAKLIQKSTDIVADRWFSNLPNGEVWFELFLSPLAMLDLSPLNLIAEKERLAARVASHHIGMLYLDALSFHRHDYIQTYYRNQLKEIQKSAPFLSFAIEVAFLEDAVRSFPTYAPPKINSDFANIYKGLLTTSLSLRIRYDFLMTLNNVIENFSNWALVADVSLESWVTHYQCYLALVSQNMSVLDATFELPKIKEPITGKKRLLSQYETENCQATLEESRKKIQSLETFVSTFTNFVDKKDWDGIKQLLTLYCDETALVWFFKCGMIQLILEYGDEKLCGKLTEDRLRFYIDSEKADDFRRIEIYQKIFFSKIPESLKKTVLFYWAGNKALSLENVLYLSRISNAPLHQLVLEDIFIDTLRSINEMLWDISLFQLLSKVKKPLHFYEWAVCSPFVSIEKKKILFEMYIEEFFYEKANELMHLSSEKPMFKKNHLALVSFYFEKAKKELLFFQQRVELSDTGKEARLIEVLLSANQVEIFNIHLLHRYIKNPAARFSMEIFSTLILNSHLEEKEKIDFFMSDIKHLSVNFYQIRFDSLENIQNLLSPAGSGTQQKLLQIIEKRISIMMLQKNYAEEPLVESISRLLQDEIISRPQKNEILKSVLSSEQAIVAQAICDAVTQTNSFSYFQELYDLAVKKVKRDYYLPFVKASLQTSFSSFFSAGTDLLGPLEQRLRDDTLEASDLTLFQNTIWGRKNLLAKLIQQTPVKNRVEYLRRIVISCHSDELYDWFCSSDKSFFSTFVLGNNEKDLCALLLLKEKPALCTSNLLTSELLAVLYRRVKKSRTVSFQQVLHDVLTHQGNADSRRLNCYQR